MSKEWAEKEYRVVIDNAKHLTGTRIWDKFFRKTRSVNSVKTVYARVVELQYKGKSSDEILAALTAYKTSYVWSDAQKEFIAAHYQQYSNKELVDMMEKEFGIMRTAQQIQSKLNMMGLRRRNLKDYKPRVRKPKETPKPKEAATPKELQPKPYKPATFAESVLDRHWSGERFKQGTKEYEVAKKYNFIAY